MGFDASSLATADEALSKGVSREVVAFATLLTKRIPRRAPDYAKPLARFAVFAYLLGFAIDLNINVLLLLLAGGSIAAVWLNSGKAARPPRSPIVHLVALFLLVAALSILLSEDIGRSLRLSAPLVPAILLFFLIHEYFDDASDLRHLYACLTLVALGLAIALLSTAMTAGEWYPAGWIAALGSPILIVPNDTTFLAIIAPLALALVYHQPRSRTGAAASLVLTLMACTVAVYGSRGATLTFLVGTACTAAALSLKRYLLAIAGIFAVVAVFAYLFDLPLLSKFSQILSDGRLSHWASAWMLFLEAPLLGHGLHTFIDTSLHPQGVTWVHNLYLQTLAEQGIVGLLTLGLVLTYALVMTWKSLRTRARDQRALGAGAFGALVGFCVASVFELALLREWVTIALFVLLAVVARVPSLTAED